MVCTFGDTTDVTWWRDLDLPVRPVLGPDGRLLAAAPPGITSQAGRSAYRQLAGATLAAARQRIEALARASGDLLGEPEPVTHPVKFYEKGDTPLEIITTRQWYLRNGGRDEALRAALLGRGREIGWHPEHMRARYENWVAGLTGDWLLSRQRYFGVPIPVWYPLDAAGQPRYDQPIPAGDDALPVDPAAEPPPGYTAAQRGQPGGFAADPDVLDTWATSSLTPRIAAASAAGVSLDQVYPMDLRPQAHEIIRTWLFYTVLRAHLADGVLPVAARGHLRLDPGPGPEEDVQVPRQRGHADGFAAPARLRRGALLGGQRPPRHRHDLRPGTAAGGPQARHQDT